MRTAEQRRKLRRRANSRFANVKWHHQGQEQGQIRKVINGRVRMQLSAGPCLNYLKLPITLMMRRAHVTAPYMDRRSPCFSSASRDTFPAGGGTAARGARGGGGREDGGRRAKERAHAGGREKRREESGRLRSSSRRAEAHHRGADMAGWGTAEVGESDASQYQPRNAR